MCLRRPKLPALGCKQSNLYAHRGGKELKTAVADQKLCLQSMPVQKGVLPAMPFPLSKYWTTKVLRVHAIEQKKLKS